MEEFTWPSDVTDEQVETVSAILWVLRAAGPVVDEESGRATKLLTDLLGEKGIDVEGTLNKYLNSMDVSTRSGRYGKLIRRKRTSTRTYRIELAIDPRKDPFPPNPFEGIFPEEDPEQEAENEDEEEITVEVADGEEDDGDVDISDIDAFTLVPEERTVEPGTELVPMDEGRPGLLDQLLYIQSTVGDVIEQYTEEKLDRHAAAVEPQFEAFERVVRENEQLKRENAQLRDLLTQLRRARGARR